MEYYKRQIRPALTFGVFTGHDKSTHKTRAVSDKVCVELNINRFRPLSGDQSFWKYAECEPSLRTDDLTNVRCEGKRIVDVLPRLQYAFAVTQALASTDARSSRAGGTPFMISLKQQWTHATTGA